MKTDLIEAFLSGELDKDEAASVESALRKDEELREIFFKQKQLDAALKVIFSGSAEVSSHEFSRGVLATLNNESAGDQRHFSKSVLTEILEEKEKIVPVRWPDFIKAAAVAAVAVLALMIGLQTIDLSKITDDETADTTENSGNGGGFGEFAESGYMARVETTKDAVFSEECRETMRKDGWVSGGVLELESGVAEVSFNSGARAFLEGPAKLSVASDNRAFLEFGSLTAEVSPGAAGFTVNTPRMNIVDIGTRFGVLVNEDGNTEVHVMEGIVEASRSSGHTVDVVLSEGLAIKADSRTLSALVPIPYSGHKFELTAGVSHDPSPVIEYRFDESGGPEIIDSGNRRLGGPYDLSLLGEGSFEDSPRRSPGVRGGGLVFRQNQTIATSLSKEFRLENPFTISFWMKIPPEIGRRVEDYVLGLGRAGTGWEFGCRNGIGGGALIAKNGDHFIAGSTDLADGKWHHVAIRFIGGEGDQTHPQLKSHLHLYVDGALETISAWNNGAIEPGAIEPGRAGELRIGDLENSGFPGWIDQVAVFDQAISTQAIQKLVTNPYRNGQ